MPESAALVKLSGSACGTTGVSGSGSGCGPNGTSEGRGGATPSAGDAAFGARATRVMVVTVVTTVRAPFELSAMVVVSAVTVVTANGGATAATLSLCVEATVVVTLAAVSAAPVSAGFEGDSEPARAPAALTIASAAHIDSQSM
ncbi:MAG: hypothetical protein IPJ04_12000 [Candidatus Eisenbacteria bacterium]|nr:hypothetical protein [Candidatus Eisenbacteria bacterium]